VAYTKLTGDPKKGAVPAGEYNVLESLMGEWESLVGYSVEPTKSQLLAMANTKVQSLADFGRYMSGTNIAASAVKAMPWANYGLTKDEYVSTSTIFGTTYKEITGTDISPSALQQAFKNPRDPTGGLLSGAQYKQQLMNDTNIQNAYGWVKYGMDFAAWTQQKLQLRSTFGKDIQDSQAATILQYNKAATGSNMGAQLRSQQQTAPVGVGQSVVR
jgi:hypothetical protein